jgi:hypothetical protein
MCVTDTLCRIYVANPSNQSYNSTSQLSFIGIVTDSRIAFYSKTIVTSGVNNIGTTESRFYLGGSIQSSKKVSIH